MLNCRPSSSGTYPNLGPLLLVEAGILLVDLPDDALFDLVSDGDPLVLIRARRRRRERRAAGAEVASAASEVLRRGERARPARGVRAETEARRREVGEALERFAHNTIEHMREERELLAGRIELPRFAPTSATAPTLRGRARRRPPARPARAAPVHPRHAPGDRRRRRRRRGAAGGGPDAGHDRRRHGLGGRGRAALRRRARRPLLPRRPRARDASAWRSSGCPSSSCRRRARARTWRC